MKQKLKKRTTKFHQTDRKKRLIIGGVIAFLLAITPFLFYLYRYAPEESVVWQTKIGTIDSGGFGSVQSFIHALFTKITFVIITALWFITSRDWWKWAILIPFMMFLFQLLGVLNYKHSYVDEFDFWYALPFIVPIIVGVIWISHELKKIVGDLDLKDEIEGELKQYEESYIDYTSKKTSK